MKYYEVTMIIALNDDASHPRKWVSETIGESLNSGEDVVSTEYRLLTEQEVDDLV
jgi:hypothetical protein